MKYVLLTGGTGLVGRYLVRDLLLSGHRLALVLRTSGKETVEQRAESILQYWEAELGRTLPRPVCLQGDVAEPGLALSQVDRDWIKENCDRVLHNAAILTFYEEDRTKDPWRTNLGGTQHVLELCRETGIDDLHYVSTAYVCGNRSDMVKEDQLDVGQGFRNDYEHSKFLAEKMVREAPHIRQLTVYRPAVIAGDANTGYTNTYHGLYFYLKLMSVLLANTPKDPDGRRHTPIRLEMTGDEPRNVVPVDWISAVMVKLFNNPAAHGGTYHLSPDQLITPRKIIDAGYKYFDSYGVEFVGKPVAPEGLSDFEKAAYENKTIYQPYEQTDPTFDTTNLKKFAGDVPCPEIDEPMLHRFWKYGEEDRWGKRRQPKPAVGFDVGGFLAQQLPAMSEEATAVSKLGLSVMGPSGGQWTLLLTDAGDVSFVRGLPSCDAPQLELTNSEFASLVQGEMVSAHQPIVERLLATTSDEQAAEIATRLLAALVPSESQTASAGGVASGN